MKGLWALFREEDGYLDVGVASILFQVLLGILISLPALMLVFRHKIVNFFRKGKK